MSTNRDIQCTCVAGLVIIALLLCKEAPYDSAYALTSRTTPPVRLNDGRLAIEAASNLPSVRWEMRAASELLHQAGASFSEHFDAVDHRDQRQEFAGTSANPIGWQIDPVTGARLITAMQLQPHDVFVDLGCSTGVLCFLAAQFTPAREIVGIELSPTRHQVAEECLQNLKTISKSDPQFNRVKFLAGDFNKPQSDEIRDVLNRATVVYYACNHMVRFDNETGAAITKYVESIPVLTKLQTGTRFISLSLLSPDFEMWREVELVGAYNVDRAYSWTKRRLRLALEYRVLAR